MSYSTTEEATLEPWNGAILDLRDPKRSGDSNATSRGPLLPRSEAEVDSSIPFIAAEQLFRRVLPSEELADGEIDPTRFNSVSFSPSSSRIGLNSG